MRPYLRRAYLLQEIVADLESQYLAGNLNANRNQVERNGPLSGMRDKVNMNPSIVRAVVYLAFIAVIFAALVASVLSEPPVPEDHWVRVWRYNENDDDGGNWDGDHDDGDDGTWGGSDSDEHDGTGADGGEPLPGTDGGSDGYNSDGDRGSDSVPSLTYSSTIASSSSSSSSGDDDVARRPSGLNRYQIKVWLEMLEDGPSSSGPEENKENGKEWEGKSRKNGLGLGRLQGIVRN